MVRIIVLFLCDVMGIGLHGVFLIADFRGFSTKLIPFSMQDKKRINPLGRVKSVAYNI